MSPQSTAMRSSPDSTSIMFRPISPRPPRGINRTRGSIKVLSTQERHRSIRSPAGRHSETPGQALESGRMAAITGVLFDLGGVVMDSPLVSIARYEADHGVASGAVNRSEESR